MSSSLWVILPITRIYSICLHVREHEKLHLGGCSPYYQYWYCSALYNCTCKCVHGVSISWWGFLQIIRIYSVCSCALGHGMPKSNWLSFILVCILHICVYMRCLTLGGCLSLYSIFILHTQLGAFPYMAILSPLSSQHNTLWPVSV